MGMTERLEMRLESETVERLDEWRRGQSDVPSRSEAVRRLVEEGLERAGAPARFHPNNTEKLMLWMLSQIRRDQITARKDQKGAEYDLKDLTRIDEAIYGGHFWGLEWEMTGIFHDYADTPEQVSLVGDVLDMWNFIERAYAKYDDEQKGKLKEALGVFGEDPRFMGFDGNNESSYIGIARYFIDVLGRFEHFKGRDLNSHMPTVARYGHMARKFEEIRKNLYGRELTVSEMIELLERERRG